jgi:hypothetical protein
MQKSMVLLFECGVGFSMFYLIGSILGVGAKLFILLASYQVHNLVPKLMDPFEWMRL